MNRHLLFAVLLLLGAISGARPALPGPGREASPLVGAHTLRADDALLQLVAESGFVWLVQLLEWREVEPLPGELFWEYADWLVRAADYYGLELVLRLDHPPEWALAPGNALPFDVAAYAAFVGRVADRYRGRVAAYVVWNEPNLAVEWGGQPPDPAAYTELLCAAQAAIRAADPQALVVSAGLAPTNHAADSALDDRLYLRAIYAAGAAACFDVLGAHPYGFAYPPGDPATAHDGLNFARLADLWAIMVEEGDGAKPVWATELGWTTEPVGADQLWLGVSEEEQARYLVGALEQACQAWPWLERIAIWNVSTGLPAGDEKRGYSILAADGTPKPAYGALAAMDKGQADREAGGQESTAGEGQGIEILAPDVVIRLSDVDTFYPHWARPHCAVDGAVPCRRWQGQFYLGEPGANPSTLLGAGPYRLRLETMQVEEPGNLIWINGHPLDPPAIPLRGRPDFASVWTVIEIAVPSGVLRPGVNVVEIEASPRLPVYQDDRAHFESLQFRNLRLFTDS
jgi:hypothetical protein